MISLFLFYGVLILVPCKLHLFIGRIHLELEFSFTFETLFLRATDDSIFSRVGDLRIELNLRTEQLKIGDDSHGYQVSPLKLRHNFALSASNHPADVVLALVSAATVT